ncbi:uncharacterized protein LOC117343473 isoform X1 [Pecten maximus]|uniref:uncharacterized protein LOC117343473 isoform X1 n=2 Tax=Pecten maximus TaxID=6579 RepID=UPI001458C9D1|nr:uncharacterized protein LOC117343473 isoform X1 [Pecten maximus]
MPLSQNMPRKMSFRDHRNVNMESKLKEVNHLDNMSKGMNKAREYLILFLTYILYKITRSIVVTFQKFTWAVTGVERTRKDAQRGLQFKLSAHVQNVLWRRKLFGMTMADPSDFITTHKCFKHPNYVLKPQISLYCITKKEAIFVEVKEGTDIHGSSEDTSLFEEQFKHAQCLISIPLASFHKVASDLGAPRVPIIWISSTGRYGSTLLTRVFAQLPGMMVLSEPDVLTSLAYLKKTNRINKGEYEQLLPSSVRLLCKPDDRAGMICVKTRPSCTGQMEDVYRNFPQIYQIYVYRNSLKTVTSSLSLFTEEPFAMMARYIIDNKILSTVMPCFRSFLYSNFCFLLDHDHPAMPPKSLSSVGIFTTSWAASISRCVEAIEARVPVIALLYEDMMKNPRKTCSILFDFLDIRREYIASATEGFKVDSNRGSLSQSLVISDSRRTIPQGFRVEADSILRKHNLPRLGERYELPGLIDFEASKLSRMNSSNKFY